MSRGRLVLLPVTPRLGQVLVNYPAPVDDVPAGGCDMLEPGPVVVECMKAA